MAKGPRRPGRPIHRFRSLITLLLLALLIVGVALLLTHNAPARQPKADAQKTITAVNYELYGRLGNAAAALHLVRHTNLWRCHRLTGVWRCQVSASPAAAAPDLVAAVHEQHHGVHSASKLT